MLMEDIKGPIRLRAFPRTELDSLSKTCDEGKKEFSLTEQA